MSIAHKVNEYRHLIAYEKKKCRGATAEQMKLMLDTIKENTKKMNELKRALNQNR